MFMRKALVVLAVLVLAAVAWAGNMLGGNVKITMPGGVEHKVYFETLAPGVSSFEVDGETFTFVPDEEHPGQGIYCGPAGSGRAWEFTLGSTATYTFPLPFPQLGFGQTQGSYSPQD
jgi:hypothetical protein